MRWRAVTCQGGVDAAFLPHTVGCRLRLPRGKVHVPLVVRSLHLPRNEIHLASNDENSPSPTTSPLSAPFHLCRPTLSSNLHHHHDLSTASHSPPRPAQHSSNRKPHKVTKANTRQNKRCRSTPFPAAQPTPACGTRLPPSHA